MFSHYPVVRQGKQHHQLRRILFQVAKMHLDVADTSTGLSVFRYFDVAKKPSNKLLEKNNPIFSQRMPTQARDARGFARSGAEEI